MMTGKIRKLGLVLAGLVVGLSCSVFAQGAADTFSQAHIRVDTISFYSLEDTSSVDVGKSVTFRVTLKSNQGTVTGVVVDQNTWRSSNPPVMMLNIPLASSTTGASYSCATAQFDPEQTAMLKDGLYFKYTVRSGDFTDCLTWRRSGTVFAGTLGDINVGVMDGTAFMAPVTLYNLLTDTPAASAAGVDYNGTMTQLAVNGYEMTVGDVGNNNETFLYSGLVPLTLDAGATTLPAADRNMDAKLSIWAEDTLGAVLPAITFANSDASAPTFESVLRLRRVTSKRVYVKVPPAYNGQQIRICYGVPAPDDVTFPDVVFAQTFTVDENPTEDNAVLVQNVTMLATPEAVPGVAGEFANYGLTVNAGEVKTLAVKIQGHNVNDGLIYGQVERMPATNGGRNGEFVSWAEVFSVADGESYANVAIKGVYYAPNTATYLKVWVPGVTTTPVIVKVTVVPEQQGVALAWASGSNVVNAVECFEAGEASNWYSKARPATLTLAAPVTADTKFKIYIVKKNGELLLKDEVFDVATGNPKPGVPNPNDFVAMGLSSADATSAYPYEIDFNAGQVTQTLFLFGLDEKPVTQYNTFFNNGIVKFRAIRQELQADGTYADITTDKYTSDLNLKIANATPVILSRPPDMTISKNVEMTLGFQVGDTIKDTLTVSVNFGDGQSTIYTIYTETARAAYDAALAAASGMTEVDFNKSVGRMRDYDSETVNIYHTYTANVKTVQWSATIADDCRPSAQAAMNGTFTIASSQLVEINPVPATGFARGYGWVTMDKSLGVNASDTLITYSFNRGTPQSQMVATGYLSGSSNGNGNANLGLLGSIPDATLDSFFYKWVLPKITGILTDADMYTATIWLDLITAGSANPLAAGAEDGGDPYAMLSDIGVNAYFTREWHPGDYGIEIASRSEETMLNMSDFNQDGIPDSVLTFSYGTAEAARGFMEQETSLYNQRVDGDFFMGYDFVDAGTDVGGEMSYEPRNGNRPGQTTRAVDGQGLAWFQTTDGEAHGTAFTLGQKIRGFFDPALNAADGKGNWISNPAWVIYTDGSNDRIMLASHRHAQAGVARVGFTTRDRIAYWLAGAPLTVAGHTLRLLASEDANHLNPAAIAGYYVDLTSDVGTVYHIADPTTATALNAAGGCIEYPIGALIDEPFTGTDPRNTSWVDRFSANPAVIDKDQDGVNDAVEYFYWYYASRIALIPCHYGQGTDAAGDAREIATPDERYWGTIDYRRRPRENAILADGAAAGSTAARLTLGWAYNPAFKGDAGRIPSGLAISAATIMEHFNPLVDSGHARLDSDSDGVANLNEFEFGMNMIHWDTDTDGMADVWEYMHGPGASDDHLAQGCLGAMNPLANDARANPDVDYCAMLPNEDGTQSYHNTVYETLGFDPRTAWYLPNLRHTTWTAQMFGGRGAYMADGNFAEVNTVDFNNELEYQRVYQLEGNVGVGALYGSTTCPCMSDSDNDGAPDGWELYVGMNPFPKGADVVDTAPNSQDSDGISPVMEFACFAAYKMFNDGAYAVAQNPAIGNHCNLNWMNKVWPTDPNNVDTDYDGLTDGMEGSRFTYATDENSMLGCGCNPTSLDTDDDAIPDAWEFLYSDENYAGPVDGANPTQPDPTTTELSGTSDADLFPDGTLADFDGDGLSNYQESRIQLLRQFRYDLGEHESRIYANTPGDPVTGRLDDVFNFDEDFANPSMAELNIAVAQSVAEGDYQDVAAWLSAMRIVWSRHFNATIAYTDEAIMSGVMDPADPTVELSMVELQEALDEGLEDNRAGGDTTDAMLEALVARFQQGDAFAYADAPNAMLNVLQNIIDLQTAVATDQTEVTVARAALDAARAGGDPTAIQAAERNLRLAELVLAVDQGALDEALANEEDDLANANAFMLYADEIHLIALARIAAIRAEIANPDACRDAWVAYERTVLAATDPRIKTLYRRAMRGFNGGYWSANTEILLWNAPAPEGSIYPVLSHRPMPNFDTRLADGPILGSGVLPPDDFEQRDLGDPLARRHPYFATTNPNTYDSDRDGMDDFYELFHGINPILGAFSGASAVVASDMQLPARLSRFSDIIYDISDPEWALTAANNSFNPPNFTMATSAGYNFFLYPWMNGAPWADPDGDGLINSEEAPNAFVSEPSNYGTDPSPIWFTDPQNPHSFVARFFLDLMPYEVNEGYDTDGDGVGDKMEVAGSAEYQGNPQTSFTPARRQAMYFPGDGVLQTLTNFSVGPMSMRNFTIEAWIKPDTPTTVGTQIVLDRPWVYDNANLLNAGLLRHNFRLGVEINAAMEILPFADFTDTGDATTYPASSPKLRSSKALAPNQWTHLAASYDGATFTLYVNGVAVRSGATTLVPATGIISLSDSEESFEQAYYYLEAPVVIGATPTQNWTPALQDMNPGDPLNMVYTSFFCGFIDDVRIWNGSRSVTEISANYRRELTRDDLLQNRLTIFTERFNGNGPYQKTLPTAELLAYYNFNDIFCSTEASPLAPTSLYPDQTVETGNKGYLKRQQAYLNAAGDDWADKVPADLFTSFYGQLPLRSAVYAVTNTLGALSYEYVPWIENAMMHLPPMNVQFRNLQMVSMGLHDPLEENQSVGNFYLVPNNSLTGELVLPDSKYWNPQVVGAANFTSLLNVTADPYGMVFRTQFEFSPYSFMALPKDELSYVNDVLPLGGAYARYDAFMWDNKGSSTDPDGNGGDSDGDGIPDDVVDAGGNNTWFDDVAGSTGSVGSNWLDVHVKKNQTGDTDGDGMQDWFEIYYGLAFDDATGDNGAFGDPDGDGFWNYGEWLARSNPKRFDTLGTGLPDAQVPVWSRRGRPTLGLLYSDGDFMEETWEALYTDSNNSETPNVDEFDPDGDADRDGWSNWAECRTGLNAFIHSTNPTETKRAIYGGYEVPEYPTPTLEMTFTYAGNQILNAANAANLVIEAYSETTVLSTPDATFTISLAPEAVEHTQTLGTLRDGTLMGVLEPGYLTPGSLTFQATTFIPASATGGTPTVMPLTNMAFDNGSGTLTAATQREDGTFYDRPVGTIDYQTGEFTYVPELFPAPGQERFWVLNGQQIPQVGASVIAAYTTLTSSADWPKTFHVVTPAAGHLREGMNRFFAYIDLDANGRWTEGEPASLASAGIGSAGVVNVGWDKVEPLHFALSENPPSGTVRVDLSTVINAVITPEAEDDAAADEEGDAEPEVVSQYMFDQTASSYYLMLVDDASRVFVKHIPATKTTLTEADILSLSPAGLKIRYGMTNGNSFPLDVYLLSPSQYESSVGQEQLTDYLGCKIYTMTNTFQAINTSANVTKLISPVGGAQVTSARPTFVWTSSMRALSFDLTIAKDGTVVYQRSGIPAPGAVGAENVNGVVDRTYRFEYKLEDSIGDLFGNRRFAAGDYSYTLTLRTYDGSGVSTIATPLTGSFHVEMVTPATAANYAGAYNTGYYKAKVYYSGVCSTAAAGLNRAKIRISAHKSASFNDTAAVQTSDIAAPDADLSATLQALNTDVVTTSDQVRLNLDGSTRFWRTVYDVNMCGFDDLDADYYTMAYIDLNDNGVRDTFEPWGYATLGADSEVGYGFDPRAIKATRSASYNTIEFYIQDMDSDNDGIADTLEWMSAGFPKKDFSAFRDLIVGNASQQASQISPTSLSGRFATVAASVESLSLAGGDTDGDGLSDYLEQLCGTPMNSATAREDGMTDLAAYNLFGMADAGNSHELQIVGVDVPELVTSPAGASNLQTALTIQWFSKDPLTGNIYAKTGSLVKAPSYVLYGKRELTDATWTKVKDYSQVDGAKASLLKVDASKYKFFKVQLAK